MTDLARNLLTLAIGEARDFARALGQIIDDAIARGEKSGGPNVLSAMDAAESLLGPGHHSSWGYEQAVKDVEEMTLADWSAERPPGHPWNGSSFDDEPPC